MTALAETRARRGIEWVPVFFGLAAMYVPTFVDLAMGLWRSDEQMHGPIILAVCLYLFWSLRHTVQTPPSRRAAPSPGRSSSSACCSTSSAALKTSSCSSSAR